jgi:hypothetical protein
MGIRRAIWTEEVADSSGVLSRVGIGHSGDDADCLRGEAGDSKKRGDRMMSGEVRGNPDSW